MDVFVEPDSKSGSDREYNEYDEDIEKTSALQNQFDDNQKPPGLIQDWFFLILYLIVFCGLVASNGLVVSHFKTFKTADRTDSFGNLCGALNNKVKGIPLSGRDMSEHKYLFHFSKADVKTLLDMSAGRNEYYVRICVQKCPSKALLCPQLLEANGYGSWNVPDEVRDKRACFSHRQVILPFKYGTVSCVPHIVGLVTEVQRPEEEDITLKNRAIGKLSFKIIKTIDLYFYHIRFITNFIFQALFFSYIFTYMMMKKTRFSLIYFMIVGVHAALLGFFMAIVKWIQLNKGVKPSDFQSESVRDFINEDTIRYLRDYLPTPAPKWYTETLSTNDSMEDFEATIAPEISGTFDTNFDLAFWGYLAVSSTLLLKAFNTATKSRWYFDDSRLDVTTKLIKVFHEITSKLPFIYFAPIITIWPCILLTLYWTIFAYWLFVPSDYSVSKDETVKIESSDPAWKWILRFATSASLLWSIEFSRSCEAFIIGCATCCAFHQSEGDSYLKTNKQVCKLLVCSIGQIAHGSLVRFLVMPLRIMLMVWEKLGLDKRGCGAACCRFLCGCFGDWNHIRQYNDKSLISVSMFGETYWAATLRYKILTRRHVPFLRDVEKTIKFNVKCLCLTVAAFSAMACLELHERKSGFGEFGPQGLPIATVFTLSLFVANGVTKIQTVGVSAVIFCYCVDMEVNDGSEERPYTSPPELIAKMGEIRIDMRKKKNGSDPGSGSGKEFSFSAEGDDMFG